jgi:hypothetical protein
VSVPGLDLELPVDRDVARFLAVSADDEPAANDEVVRQRS